MWPSETVIINNYDYMPRHHHHCDGGWMGQFMMTSLKYSLFTNIITNMTNSLTSLLQNNSQPQKSSPYYNPMQFMFYPGLYLSNRAYW